MAALQSEHYTEIPLYMAINYMHMHMHMYMYMYMYNHVDSYFIKINAILMMLCIMCMLSVLPVIPGVGTSTLKV